MDLANADGCDDDLPAATVDSVSSKNVGRTSTLLRAFLRFVASSLQCSSRQNTCDSVFYLRKESLIHTS